MEELETHEEGQRKSKTPKTFWKSLSWIEIGAIIAPIIFIVYLHNSTALVLNYNNGNETRIINGIPNPPNTIIYPPNSYVPKSNVSNTQAVIGSAIYLICIGILLQRRLKQARRATPKEAMDDLSKQLKQLTHLPLADGTTIPITDNLKINLNPTFITRYYEESEGKRIAWRYAFDVLVEDKREDTKQYYRIYYHPWDWCWDGFFPINSALMGKDTCPDCGKEYNFKSLHSKLIRELRELKRGFSGGMGRI